MGAPAKNVADLQACVLMTRTMAVELLGSDVEPTPAAENDKGTSCGFTHLLTGEPAPANGVTPSSAILLDIQSGTPADSFGDKARTAKEWFEALRVSSAKTSKTEPTTQKFEELTGIGSAAFAWTYHEGILTGTILAFYAAERAFILHYVALTPYPDKLKADAEAIAGAV